MKYEESCNFLFKQIFLFEFLDALLENILLANFREI